MNNYLKIDKTLPTSINVIGWFYTFIGVLVTVVGVLLGLGIGFAASIFKQALGVVGGLIIGVFFALVGVGIVFLGQGLLQKNKAAWVVGIVLSALSILNALGKTNGTNIVQIVWSVFVIWKLYEHRNLYGISTK